MSPSPPRLKLRLNGSERLSPSGKNSFALEQGDGSAMRVSHVVNASRPITAELALLFGRAFGQAPEYWLNLQAQYDLRAAEEGMGNRLNRVSPLALPRRIAGPRRVPEARQKAAKYRSR